MSIGNQLYAPDGLGDIEKDERLYLLRLDPILERVVLVSFYFHKQKNHANVYKHKLFILKLSVFQDALTSKTLQPYKPHECVNYPPWLAYMNGKTPFQDPVLNGKVNNKGMTQQDQVDQRLILLNEAIMSVDQILLERSPERALNRFAQACKPPQCEIRFRLWFFSYLAHDYNKWVLLPPNAGRGTYHRSSDKYENSKFGKGKGGNRMSEASISRIYQGFFTHCRVGTPFNEVYRLVITMEFGVVPRNKNNPREGFYHPAGDPFPTRAQFRYQCEKKIGRHAMQRALKGNQKFRSENAPVQGSYTEWQSHIFQSVNSDARQIDEHPRSMISGHLMPKLWVVELYDSLGGYGGGIGFSIGGEKSAAYLRALFCMAISKSKFGEIIGYKISEASWPCIGLPPSFISDRGPGAASLTTNKLDELLMSHSMPPSYTPQSNSRAESLHPKKMKRQGAPEYVVSHLNVIQMAHKAVEELILTNRTSSAMAVASPEMIARGVQTKHDFFMDMSTRYLSDLRSIPFETAVRNFLDPIELRISDGVLRYKQAEFSSDRWKETEIFEKSRQVKGDAAVVKGYICHPFRNCIWLELAEGLIEVQYRKAFRDGEETMYLSTEDLELVARKKSSTKYQLEGNRLVAKTISKDKFKSQTEANMHGGTTKKGRPKTKTIAAINEMTHLQNS